MINLDINANWWNPKIETTAIKQPNPSTTRIAIVAAVAGQHIVLTHITASSTTGGTGTSQANAELFWGTAANILAANAEDRIFIRGYSGPVVTLNPHTGFEAMWPLGVQPVGPVNTQLSIRNDSNMGGEALWSVGYYMVDSTTLRPV